MDGPTSDLILRDDDLGPFFRDADRTSVESQARHLRQVKLQLALLVFAAISGAATISVGDGKGDLAGILGALCFGSALFVRLYSEHQEDEQEWYESRAAAESAKTLCWRYSVAGNPFPASMPRAEARQLLVDRLASIGRELRFVRVSPISGGDGETTDAMERMRDSTLSQRALIYASARIATQQSWYSTKSEQNEKQARMWLAIVLVADFGGLVGAVLKASGTVSFDLLGIFGAAAAAMTAWLQTKQHRTLATAYSLAARELRQISSLVSGASADSANWATFVDQAEEAISREHTMWVASRTGRRLGT